MLSNVCTTLSYNDGIWKGRVYMHEELKVGKAEILRGKGDQA